MLAAMQTLCFGAWISGLALGLLLPAASAFAQADHLIYTDSLQNGWENWSWSATVDFNQSTRTHSGAKAVRVAITGLWGGFSLHRAALDTGPYTSLSFWIHGGPAGGQKLRIYAELDTNAGPALELPALPANAWQPLAFPLAALGAAGQSNLTRFSIQDVSGSAGAEFYLDDIQLTASPETPTNSPVAITVDAGADRHPISPLIYGTAFASASEMVELNFTINRSGGNSESRYNWLINAHNRANDWYFQSLADNPATPAAFADAHIAATKSAGAEAAITIPMLGWMPKLGPGRGKLASYSIAKYGPQTGHDAQWMPDAGNGISITNNTPIIWNDPTDANFLTNTSFQEAFVRHLTNRWGVAANGGPRYYLMDNEWSLWHETHRDIHPQGETRPEGRDRFLAYAAMVKANDPDALVLGPEEFGWSGYLHSGADLQYGAARGWSYLPDRATNGGLDHVAWFLDQCRRHDAAAGRRHLDFFTLHRYPEGAERNDNGNDVSPATQLLRNRSTRSFWDPNYVDESWINTPVKLIPRMKQWAAAYYPGTRLGLTEYNWHAENHINGATAQADLLGIFGREGLDLATRWTTPAASTPTFKAMKLYRNYDGNRSAFGELSVKASGPNPDQVAVFAAVRSGDGALTLMVINKQAGVEVSPVITLTNFAPAGSARLWQLTAANQITRLADLALAGPALSNTLPAQSVTLYVIPAAPPEPPRQPAPPDGAAHVPLPADLAWTPGANAGSHRVFFGTASNAVRLATAASPEFLGSFAAPACPAPGAAPSARYFWRVEEVNEAASVSGPVWTFSTAAAPGAALALTGEWSAPEGFALTFSSTRGQRYQIERNDSLNPATWTALTGGLPGTGDPLRFLDDEARADQRFYRVVILAP